MKPAFSTLFTGAALILSGVAAQADEVCMPASEMKASLVDWYAEAPVAKPGEDRQQLWASVETGTWTMVKFLSDGNACVVAQGTDWMAGTGEGALLAQLSD